ncbi:MAG: DUF2851 family protein [Bacteroidales bacterium]|nr:DUF2851 family protein [Bacteroidales bacterium]
MTEEFLHYIWKFRLFDQNIKLTTGEDCDIIDVGKHNKDSGPDFFNARIKTGDTIWAGNIEIHVKSSDWFVHDHQHDKAYDNIILHVVYIQDKVIKRRNGEVIPAIELKGKYNKTLFDRYSEFMTNRNWIPCEKMIFEVNRFILNNWLDRLMIERLENKAVEIEEQLKFNENNREQTFYEFLARNFGFKVNSVPFELLAKSLPLLYLGKHKNNKFQIEALLFGQAGLLSRSVKDEYFQDLKKEYKFLQKKFSLIPIDPHLWRFMRLRPSNFPTIRLAQFADLICNSSHLFSKILEVEKLNDMLQLFDVSVSEYWEDHYTFGKVSPKRKKKMGRNTINLIVINTIVPFIFIYGRIKNDQRYIDRSLKFLEQIPGETNAIIKKWEELSMSTRTAFNTQALLQLKNAFCNKKKCLECSIGNELLKKVATGVSPPNEED